VQGNNVGDDESEDIMKTTIDMAREAGAIHVHERPKEFALVGNDSLKAFEALARADEREACAKECKLDRTSADIEIAIRARGQA
jgi:hypothetical protein